MKRAARLFLFNIQNIPSRKTRTAVFFYLLAPIADNENYLGYRVGERRECVINKRFTLSGVEGHPYQRLRNIVRKRPHPLTAPGGQNNCPHISNYLKFSITATSSGTTAKGE